MVYKDTDQNKVVEVTVYNKVYEVWYSKKNGSEGYELNIFDKKYSLFKIPNNIKEEVARKFKEENWFELLVNEYAEKDVEEGY